MGDVQEVEAEVVEDGGLSVTYVPATVSANFDALEERVRAMCADYEGATYDLTDPEAVRDAKRHRTYLNGIARQIDERRKAVKREYMRPLEEFDSRAREVAAIATDAAKGIKVQIDEAEEARKAERMAALEEHYGEYAGLLAPVVPYERVHEPRWLNKTCQLAKAEAEMDEKVERLASDWEALKRSLGGSEFYDVAERVLFSTLDLGQAIAASARAEEEAERIRALRAAMTQPTEVVEPEPEPEPEPKPEQAEACEPRCEASWPCVEEPHDWCIRVNGATRSQMEDVARALRGLGVTGRISMEA